MLDQIWTYVLFPKVYLEYQFCWTKKWILYFSPQKQMLLHPKKIWIPNLLLKKHVGYCFFVKQYVGYQVFVQKNIMDIRFFVEETMYKIRLLFKNYCFFQKKLEYQMACQKIILNIIFLPKNNFEYRFLPRKQLWILFFFRNTYWLSDFLFLIIFSISLFVNTQHVFSSKWVSCIPTAGRNTCFFPSHAGWNIWFWEKKQDDVSPVRCSKQITCWKACIFSNNHSSQQPFVMIMFNHKMWCCITTHSEENIVFCTQGCVPN